MYKRQVTYAQAIVSLDGVRTSISQPFPILAMSDSGPVGGDRLSLSPDRVLVDIAVVPAPTYKTVPVQPLIVGQVSVGYEVVGLLPEPATITVAGSAETLRELTSVQTKPVTVVGATADVAVNVDPDLPTGVSLARPQQILVRVLVNPIEGSKTVEVAPTIRHRDDQSVVASPGSVQVIVVGPMPILSEISPQDIQVIVDVTTMGQGRFVVKPVTITPSLIRVDSLSPDKLTVDVR